MTVKSGSPEPFTGAVFVAADSLAGAAERTGMNESCKAMAQHATTRRSPVKSNRKFRTAGKDRIIFMNHCLPVQRYPKGLWTPDEIELDEVEPDESMTQGSARRNSGVVEAFPL